jgi:hypothetical protein
MKQGHKYFAILFVLTAATPQSAWAMSNKNLEAIENECCNNSTSNNTALQTAKDEDPKAILPNSLSEPDRSKEIPTFDIPQYVNTRLIQNNVKQEFVLYDKNLEAIEKTYRNSSTLYNTYSNNALKDPEAIDKECCNNSTSNNTDLQTAKGKNPKAMLQAVEEEQLKKKPRL